MPTTVTAYDLHAISPYALPRPIRLPHRTRHVGEMLEDLANARNQHPLASTRSARLPGSPHALFAVFPSRACATSSAASHHEGNALDHGFHVVVFPEGNRDPRRASPLPPGIGLLVKQPPQRS